MNEKAIELLKKAKKSVHKDMQLSKSYGDRFGVCINTYESAINETLALLRAKQPAGEFTSSYRNVIKVVDPIANSLITIDNKEIKILADWSRKACAHLDAAEAIEQQHCDQIERMATQIEELEVKNKQLRAEKKEQYDKGFLEGAEAQEAANREHIIEPLEAENKRLEEAIVMLKTQLIGGSENDSCMIEGMDEAKALKGK